MATLGPDTIIPASPCVACGHVMDRANEADGTGAPQPGDFTLCIKCGALNVFADDLTHRAPMPEEDADANANPLIQALRIALRCLHGPRNARRN